MKKYICFIAILSTVSGFAAAQHTGIRFGNEGWQEIREKAVHEKKLIFVDFYTEWCGPCLTMAEEVFPSMEVGDFFNRHFVNVKLDAEKGEGKVLKEKYRVVSYPTFLFIDPQNEQVVHRSSSRQDVETFLFTGKSALIPALRSCYLEREYEEGNRSREVLGAYMDYLSSIYSREKIEEVVRNYTSLPDFSLRKENDWKIFVKYIGGIDTPEFQEILKNKDAYADLFGLDEVESKMYKEFNLSSDIKSLEASPDFKGKAFLVKKNQAEKWIRQKDFKAATPLLDALMADPGEKKEELCHYLKFTVRSVLYGEYPDFWLKKCAAMAQYVAYNSEDRQDAGIHYDYARILEKLIRSVPGASDYFPASIVEKPLNGVKDYSLRPSKLKAKPHR